jgi:mRNA-degrading endonuclease RelE of RelBE toxin-antitoxin system
MEPGTAKMIYGWILHTLHKCKNPHLFGRSVSPGLAEYQFYPVGGYRVIAHILEDEVRIVFIHVRSKRWP